MRSRPLFRLTYRQQYGYVWFTRFLVHICHSNYFTQKFEKHAQNVIIPKCHTVQMKFLTINSIKSPVKYFRNRSTVKIFQYAKKDFVKIKKETVEKVAPAVHNTSQRKITKKDEASVESGILDETKPLNYRENEMKIQMLSKHLHDQIFGNSATKSIDQNVIKRFEYLTTNSYFSI